MIFAGFPPQTSLAGISVITTIPAAIIAWFPIMTPLQIMERVPINTTSPIFTGALRWFSISLFPA